MTADLFDRLYSKEGLVKLAEFKKYKLSPKFRIGEKVKIIKEGIYREANIGKIAFIEGSYSQRYPRYASERNDSQYSIYFEDGESSAWFDEDQFEVIGEEEGK